MAETLVQQPAQTDTEKVCRFPIILNESQRDAQIDVQRRAAEIMLNELEIVADDADVNRDEFSDDFAEYSPSNQRRIKVAARWIMDRHPGTVEAANLYE